MRDRRHTGPLRAAKLVRVSTAHLEQADSPQHQLSYADGEIARNGWVDTGLVYRAELTGAVILDRPDIRRMLRDAEEGLFDAIVLKSISRLGRDVLGLLMVKRLLDDQRVEVIALADGYRSFRDPELIFLVHAERAQSGRQEIAKNVRSGIVEAAKRHIWPAGTLPFGLRKESRFVIGHHPEAAPVIQRIFELRLQHWGPVKICHHLNRELRVKGPEWWHLSDQIVSLEAKDPERKDDRIQRRMEALKTRLYKGKFLWNPKTIRSLLSNPAYYGELHYNQTIGERKVHGKLVRTPRDESEHIIIPCAPLISREEWDMVQAIGQSRKRLPHRSLQSPFMLSGLVSCGRCGSSLRGSAARPGAGRRGGDPKGYYVCRGAVDAGAHDSEYIRATDLEQAVIACLQAELAPLEGSPVKVARRPRRRVEPKPAIADIEAELWDVQASKFFRRELLRLSRMTQTEFDFEMNLIRERELELQAKLEEAQTGQAHAREDEMRLAAVREASRKLSRLEGPDDAVKALLATLVRKVIVHTAAEVEVHTTFTADEISAYQAAAE